MTPYRFANHLATLAANTLIFRMQCHIVLTIGGYDGRNWRELWSRIVVESKSGGNQATKKNGHPEDPGNGRFSQSLGKGVAYAAPGLIAGIAGVGATIISAMKDDLESRKLDLDHTKISGTTKVLMAATVAAIVLPLPIGLWHGWHKADAAKDERQELLNTIDKLEDKVDTLKQVTDMKSQGTVKEAEVSKSAAK